MFSFIAKIFHAANCKINEWIFHVIHVPQAQAILKFILHKFSPRKDILIRVRGFKMYARTLDRIAALFLWKLSGLERFESDLMDRSVKKGMTVIEIGANIGFHTIHFSCLVGEGGKVFAFEPEPENFRLLTKNLEANHCHNVIPLQKAVSASSGTVDLFVSEVHKGDHRIFDSHDGREKFCVESISLDDFLSKNPKVDFIKIDVQGAEYLALQGMKNIIKQNRGLAIICEFCPDLLIKSSASPGKFLDELTELGLLIFMIDSRNKKIIPVRKDALIRQLQGPRYVNLFLASQAPQVSL